MARKLLLLVVAAVMFATNTFAQITDVLSLTERKDLTITQIENIADAWFKRVGTGRGTGYKQFQRWLYEAKFHTDANGYLISAETEWNNYRKAKLAMRSVTSATSNSGFRTAGATWTEMGPKLWNRTSGWNPGVGRVTSIAIHPSDTTKIYISSPGGGIWKSVNSGASWTPLLDNASSSWMNIFNIAIDPSNQNTVYAAVSSGGVIKSTDAGVTWTATGSGPLSAKKVLVHPTNSSIVFVTGANGIYRSTNGGSTWTQVHTQSKEDIEFKPGDPNTMYASGNGNSTTPVSSFWRSTDNGVTWTSVDPANGVDAYGRTLIGVSAADPNVVYLVQASGSIFGKFYKSTNSGASFTTMVTGNAASGTNYFGYNTDGTGTTGQATYDMVISVNPLNANEVHIGGIILFKSTNGGTSFTAETAWSYPNTVGYTHPDMHALEWVGKTIYSGSDGGIYKSVDYGDNWNDISTGLGTRQFYRIANSKTNGSLFLGGAQDNGTSIYKSTGWIDWLGADGMDCLISPLDENLIWGTSQNGTIYRTTNGGSSYSNLTAPGTGQWVTPLAIESNTNTIYGGWTGVYKSTDNGVSWTSISGSSITTTLACLAVAPSNPQYIYASNSTALYVTTNGGSSWSTYTLASSITSIAVSPTNPAKVWVTCNSSTNRVFVSSDAGATFTNMSGNLPAITARSVAIDSDANETVYVGMNVGVYYYDIATSSWVNLSDNLPLVAVNDLKIQKSAGKIRVATYGRGVWEAALLSGASGPTCNTPTGVTAGTITNNSAIISWAAVTGASSYTLQYKTSVATTWTTVSGITTTSTTLTGLTGSTVYSYQVMTNCSSGGSTYSTAQNFTTTADPCGVPTNLSSASVTNTGATISWTAVSGAVSYDLQYKTSAATTWTTVAGITTTSYNLTGLLASTSYNYQVKTNCSAANSAYTTALSFTTLANPCSTPTNVTVASITNNSASINWTAVSGAVSYDLQYKTSAATTWTTVAGITTTTYSLAGLTGSTAYNYQVRTNCSGSSSGYSTTQSFTTSADPCGVPTSLSSASVTNNSAIVSWAAVTGAVSYDLQYKTSVATTWTTVAGITTTSYSLTGLTGNTIYNYQVKTNCSANGSAYSAAATFTTQVDPCNTPTGITASSITNNSGTISWTAVAGAVSYDLQYKTSAATTWITVAGITTTSKSLTGLTGNTVYNFQVKTNCSANGSAYSSAQNFTTLVDPCNTPTGITVSSITNTGATISWTAVIGAVSYDLQYKTSAATTWTTVAAITSTSYGLTGLIGNTVYNYQVKTNCSANGSAYSTAQNFTTLVDPCNTPTGITASSITNNGATISWAAVTGAVSYDLQYKTSAATTWTTVAGITTTSKSLTGLTGNTVYNYQVKTNCSSNGSAYSTAQNFTTLVDPCNTPTGITASSITNNGATISWSAVTGAVSYDLQYKTSASSVWTTVAGITSTSYGLTGLLGNTTYNYQVKTNCSANGSAYSIAQNFITLVDPCNTPTNVAASVITNTTATISWTAVSGAVSYDLQYKTSAATTWTTVAGITSTSYGLAGLLGNTAYNYQVKTNCSANGSVYSTSQTFTTSVDPCNTPIGITASSITNNSATISWTVVTGAVSYDLQYKTSAATAWTTVAGITTTSYGLTGLTGNTVYNYQVKTNCSANGSAYSTAQNFTTLVDPCNTPTGITASSITNNSTTISWTAVSGAVSYDLQYKTLAATTWTTVAGITTTSKTLTTLTGNTIYNYQVKTNCSANGSAYSAAQNFTTLVDPCNIPTGITASSITNNGATISWTVVTGAVSYDLQYKTSAATTWTTVAGITTASYSLTGLAGSTIYNYQVKTNCSANGSAYSTAQNFTTLVDPCNTPTGITASSITNNSTTISWAAVSGAVSYDLQYKTSAATTWTTVAGITTTSKSLTGLTGNTVYNYQVKTNCSANGSAYSTAQNFTTLVDPCNTPTGITASSITNNSAMISWTAVTGAVSYDLQYKTSAATTWTTVAGVTTTSYSLTGLTGNTIYNYQVKTNCSANGSAFSTSQNFTTLVDPCNTPTGITASSITNNGATINWTAVSGAVSYDLQYKTSAATTWTTVASITSTSYGLTGLLGNTAYNYQVKTNCSANGSAYSTSQTFTTSVDPCNTPIGITASAVTNAGATISWTAVTGAVSYDLQYKTSAATTWTTVAGITTASYSLTGLTGNTIYNYQVKTNCSANGSAYSTAQNFTTLVDPCNTPTGITASSITNNSATISWTAVTGAVSYDLQYKTSAATTWTTVAGITSTSYSLTGLTGNTIYNYQVKTNCSANGSAYSTAQNFTTLVDPCNTPTGVVAGSITNLGANISWIAVAGAVSYDLQYKVSTSKTWTTISGITVTAYNLTGLSGNTKYDYQVKTNCSANGSAYTATQSFTTLANPCTSPGNVKTPSVTNNSSTVSWTAVTDAVSYDVQYKESGSSTWITVPGVSGTSTTITDLKSNTTYNFKVKTNCNGNLAGSPYTPSVDFTTLPDTCVIPAYSLISGPVTVACTKLTDSLTVQQYSVPATSGATYSWSVSSGLMSIITNNGNNVTVRFRTGFESGSIRVTVSNNCGSYSSGTDIITGKPVLSNPIITSTEDVCAAMQTGVTYSVKRIPGAETYTWSVPAGCKIKVSGTALYTSPDTSIVVVFPETFVKDTVRVYASNSCGSSSVKAIEVFRNLPKAPVVIERTGEILSNICNNSTVTLAVPNTATNYADGYEFKLPAGVSFAGAGSNTSVVQLISADSVRVNALNAGDSIRVKVNFANTYTSGEVKVYAYRNCAAYTHSAYKGITLTKALPSEITAVTSAANTDFCANVINKTPVEFTIAKNTTGIRPTSYVWNITGAGYFAWSGTSNNKTNGKPVTIVTDSLTLKAGIVFTGGDTKVTVRPVRFCSEYGSGPEKSNSIITGDNTADLMIVGPDNPCLGTSITYTASVSTDTSKVVGYIWTKPANAQLVTLPGNALTGSKSRFLVLKFPDAASVEGYVTVRQVTACGISKADTLLLNYSATGCAQTNNYVQGLNDSVNVKQIKASVYPNPSNGLFRVRIETSNKVNSARIQVVSLMGQVMQEVEGVNVNGVIDVKLDEQKLTNGIYNVKYMVGTQTGSLKIVIQKF